MNWLVQPRLVNDPFSDPGVYLDFRFGRRALLFDLGDLAPLSARELMRVSHVFVSHTHMDHFAGFDHLLRVCLGRDNGVRMYGPPHFIEQVGHKLAAYTWNLVDRYETEFVIEAHEIHEDGCVHRARFNSKDRFHCKPLEPICTVDGLLLDEPSYKVRTAMLDHHGIASLAFRFEEGMHINVWKNRLEELGLPTGPWLTDLKRMAREGSPAETPVQVRWRTRDGAREEVFAFGVLKERVLEFVPGERVAYVTDVAGHAQNTQRLIEFLRDVDVLFIESVFLSRDCDHAIKKAHLTAEQAGRIARAARVKQAVPFHFSPRYLGEEARLQEEFEQAWKGNHALGRGSALQ
jgi:ribonuclease Z